MQILQEIYLFIVRFRLLSYFSIDFEVPAKTTIDKPAINREKKSVRENKTAELFFFRSFLKIASSASFN